MSEIEELRNEIAELKNLVVRQSEQRQARNQMLDVKNKWFKGGLNDGKLGSVYGGNPTACRVWDDIRRAAIRAASGKTTTRDLDPMESKRAETLADKYCELAYNLMPHIKEA